MVKIIRLVKKAQKGNDKAFLKLFQQYEEEMYRIAFVYVKNESDALDVVQEAAYRSFKKIHTLRNPEYFKTWLTKIAMTCAVDMIRKNKEIASLTLEHEELIGLEDEDIPLSLTLQDLLNHLDEAQKNVIVLKFYYEHTFKEISGILELPLGTTKSIFYSALRNLRKHAKEADFYE